ncbi:CBS domain-containing protein [Streptomyces sp. NPDC004059]
MGSVLVVEEGTLRGIVTVDAADDVRTAYRTFRRSGVRRLPVLDEHRLVGAGHRPSAGAGHCL